MHTNKVKLFRDILISDSSTFFTIPSFFTIQVPRRSLRIAPKKHNWVSIHHSNSKDISPFSSSTQKNAKKNLLFQNSYTTFDTVSNIIKSSEP